MGATGSTTYGPDAAHLLAEVRSLLAEVRGIEPGQVTPEARLKEDLDLDSLDVAEVATAWLVDYPAAEIEDDDLFGAKTVGDVLTLLIRVRGESRGAHESGGES